MSQKVAEHLKHESIKLRFTTSTASGAPKNVLKRSLNQTISDIIQPAAYNAAPSTTIFYERLDVSIVELETKRSLKIIWTALYNKEEVRRHNIDSSCLSVRLIDVIRSLFRFSYQKRTWSMTSKSK